MGDFVQDHAVPNQGGTGTKRQLSEILRAKQLPSVCADFSRRPPKSGPPDRGPSPTPEPEEEDPRQHAFKTRSTGGRKSDAGSQNSSPRKFPKRITPASASDSNRTSPRQSGPSSDTKSGIHRGDAYAFEAAPIARVRWWQQNDDASQKRPRRTVHRADPSRRNNNRYQRARECRTHRMLRRPVGS